MGKAGPFRRRCPSRRRVHTPPMPVPKATGEVDFFCGFGVGARKILRLPHASRAAMRAKADPRGSRRFGCLGGQRRPDSGGHGDTAVAGRVDSST